MRPATRNPHLASQEAGSKRTPLNTITNHCVIVMSSGSTSSHDTSLFREDVDRFLMNTVNNYPYYNHSQFRPYRIVRAQRLFDGNEAERIQRMLIVPPNNINGDGEPGFSPYIESAWLSGFMPWLADISRMTTQEKVENWLETSSILRFVQNNEPSS
ncbi:unnamed protein product [Caenorhabditis nigoni]